MLTGLVIFPIFMGVIGLLVKNNQLRPWILPTTGILHLSLVALVLSQSHQLNDSGWLVLDPLGKIILLLVSGLFAICSWYSVGYLHYRNERDNRFFCTCLLSTLGTMSLVTLSHHLGLMWVAIEATTLSTAPLVYFNHTPRSLEATWKYMLVGSVGIAMALLGTFFLAYASLYSETNCSLILNDLLNHAPSLSKPWLHAAFVLMLVGYGTKMGLAPMHTWKPDTYGEAPSVVGALMAGGVTSCAFLALSRIHHICLVAGDSQFVSGILIFMGLLSMGTAGFFMLDQRDYKRMLAFSSVEHMGILVFGLGLGVSAFYATLLHLINNGITKGLLFLSSGNIHRACNSTQSSEAHDAMKYAPLSTVLFIGGFLAITGSPPFGPFISLLMIIKQGLQNSHYLSIGFFAGFLILVFFGMGATVLPMIQGGKGSQTENTSFRETFSTIFPLLVLIGIILTLGSYIPTSLDNLLSKAVRFIEMQP